MWVFSLEQSGYLTEATTQVMLIQIPERSEIIDIKDAVRLREPLDQVMTWHSVLPVPLNSSKENYISLLRHIQNIHQASG
jgi:hypothetical protein